MQGKISVSLVIEELGGPAKAAQFFEISQQAISKWKRGGSIPKARLLHLKAARPDLFQEQKAA